MKYLFLAFSALFFNDIFSQERNDSTEIVQLLKEDYKTMVDHDINKHRGYCTDDYILIENGEIWNMEQEAADYKKKAHRVLERKDYFDFKFIKIVENSAYTVYNPRLPKTIN